MAKALRYIPQAGAIAFRRVKKAAALVLLVRAKKNPSHWIFPKGHIEPGESAEEASIRELREEAGIEGRIVRRAGEQDFDLNGSLYRVTYFLVEYLATAASGEPGRDPRWCTVDEAIALLTFPDTRELLRGVEAFFRTH